MYELLIMLLLTTGDIVPFKAVSIHSTLTQCLAATKETKIQKTIHRLNKDEDLVAMPYCRKKGELL